MNTVKEDCNTVFYSVLLRDEFGFGAWVNRLAQLFVVFQALAPGAALRLMGTPASRS